MTENNEKPNKNQLLSETIANAIIIGSITCFAVAGFSLHPAAGWAVIGSALVLIANAMIEDNTEELRR